VYPCHFWLFSGRPLLPKQVPLSHAPEPLFPACKVFIEGGQRTPSRTNVFDLPIFRFLSLYPQAPPPSPSPSPLFLVAGLGYGLSACRRKYDFSRGLDVFPLSFLVLSLLCSSPSPYTPSHLPGKSFKEMPSRQPLSSKRFFSFVPPFIPGGARIDTESLTGYFGPISPITASSRPGTANFLFSFFLKVSDLFLISLESLFVRALDQEVSPSAFVAFSPRPDSWLKGTVALF